MKRKMRKFLICMTAAVALAMSTSFMSLAARIAFSDPSTTAGETVDVTMKITSTGDETIGSAVVTLAYDASLLEFVGGEGASGGAGTLRVTGSTDSQSAAELGFSLTFRALRAGNATITISSQEVYDSDSQLVTVEREGTSAVTIAAAPQDSSNASLAGLQISPGSLTPAFSPDVLDYTASVGSDVTSLVVDAPALDAGASVSVSGNENLQAGDNQVICTVTAQDGQTVKTYTITVTKEAEAPADGGAESPAEDVVLRTAENSITVHPVTEDIQIPDGFVLAEVSIDGHIVQGWIWGADASQEPRYCIFYATNSKGETDFYRYDLTEKTLQRYFRDPLVDVAADEEYAALVTEYNSLMDDYQVRFYIIIGLIVLAIVLLVVVIALVVTRSGNDDFFEKRQDDRDYPQRRKSEMQKQAGSDPDKRRISKEERYMRGLEEEEAAAGREDAMRAEQQIRRRQAQKRAAAQQNAKSGRQQASSGSVQQGQNYVVRGPVTGDDEAARAAQQKTKPQEQASGKDGDSDFEVIDLE